ncbi:MAG: FAD-dependent thymidylate synthase [Candidatus Woesebacteria bacterium]|nr:FAD-dependent thymidylate synthase [Candidatus Woesebacteria bacterium]
MGIEKRELKRQEVELVLEEYTKLGESFKSPPRIALKLMSQTPNGELIEAESVAASTAIQCYAPGIAFMKNRNDEKSIGIAGSTLDAGHHTTRLHVNYTFQMVGITRSVTHDIFHTTPFYNSEQQSQRYVEARNGNYLVPTDLSTEQNKFYENACDFSNKAYFEIQSELKSSVEKRVREMNPSGGWKVEKTKERLEDKIQKITQEVARYVLPIGQHTNYFHTISELQLLRLFRASKMQNFTNEARFAIANMVNEVTKIDSSILNELDQPINDFEESEIDIDNKEMFDQFLAGRLSRLISQPQTDLFTQKLVYDAKLLADGYDVGMFDPKTSKLRNTFLKFASKLSHAGDSQRQRHRRTASNVYDIGAEYKGDHDYMTPLVIRENVEIKAIYDQVMYKMFENVDRALEMNIPKEYATLLIPNAINIRVIEGGDLFDWIHRWKQRLCYLAQEEIFFVSLDQVKDLEKIMPEIKPMLMAPCGIRKAVGISPRCPEGSRWCGQPVYNWQLKEYEKHRLI